MQKLVWQNANETELDLTSGNYGITEWEGFSNTGLNIQTQTVPFQDGGVFLDALIEQRELTVTLAIQDNNNLELRYQQRRELISALNPKLGEGYLIYTNDFISKRIKCIPNIPIFETHNSDTAGTPKASLSWVACEPYWEDLEETVVEIGREPTLIENEGDLPVGFEITVNPSENQEISLFATDGDSFIAIQDNPINYAFKISTKTGEKIAERLSMPKTLIQFTIEGSGIISQVAYSKKLELWIGVGGAYIYKSTDKENWTRAYTSVVIGGKKVIWNEVLEKFFVLTSTKLYSSANAEDWETANISGLANDICYNKIIGTIYITGSKIWETADGTTITEISSNDAICCCYNETTGDVFFGKDNTHLYLYKDGQLEQLNPIHQGADSNEIKYCFVGEFGRYIVGSYWYGVCLLSPLGAEMSYQEIFGSYCGIYNRYEDFYYIGGQETSSSDYYLWQSKNGITWETEYNTINTQANQMLEVEGKIYIVSSSEMYELSNLGNNIIDKLEKNSNMNMKINIGSNYLFRTFSSGNEIEMTLTYRKKYIGV